MQGSATSSLPRDARGRVQLAAAAVLVVLAFAGSAAVRVHEALAVAGPEASAAQVTTAASTTVTPAPAPASGFTLGDLAAGRVPQDVQDRFWQAQLDAILTAPCPERSAGGTQVTLYLGADEAWTERLTDAAAAHAEACGA